MDTNRASGSIIISPDIRLDRGTPGRWIPLPRCTPREQPTRQDPDEDFINAVLSQVPTVYVSCISPTRDAIPTEPTEASEIQDPVFIHHARLQSLSVQPSPPVLITVGINEQDFTMEVDAGAAVSILPHQLYQAILTAVALQPVDIALTGLSGGINCLVITELSPT